MSRRRNRKHYQQTAEAARLDAWENMLTFLGTAADKTTAGAFYSRRLSVEAASELYHGSDMAQTIVDSLPDDLWRGTVEISLEGEGDDAGYALESELARLDAVQLLKEAHIAGRRDGLAGLLLGAEDGQTPDRPLNLASVQSFEWLRLVEGRELIPATRYTSAGKSGTVESFDYSPIFGGGPVRIHESRFVLFEGARTSNYERSLNQGKPHSVLQAPHDVLRQFEAGWKAAEILLTDGFQSIFTTQNLAQQIGSQGQTKLEARLRLIDQQRSIGRPIVLDGGSAIGGTPPETFERTSAHLEGLPPILQQFALRLAAAAKMPVSKLMGQAPAGLNATGAADIRFWYDGVEAQRGILGRKKLLQVLAVIAAAQRTEINPDDITITWSPLWQPTETELEQSRLTRAQRLTTYVSSGVLLAEEVALSEFGGRNADVHLTDESLEARRVALSAELDRINDPPDQPISPDGAGSPGSQNPPEGAAPSVGPTGEPGSDGAVSPDRPRSTE